MAITQTDLNNSTLMKVDEISANDMKQALITANGIGHFATLPEFIASTKIYENGVHIDGYYSADDNAFGSNNHYLLPDDGTVYTEQGGVQFQTASGRWYKLGYIGQVQPSYFGLVNMKTETIRKFGLLYQAEQMGLEPTELMKEYGAKPDDGWSSGEHYITGTTYYFSVDGDDTNNGINGLSPEHPYQSLAKAKSLLITMNAGDGILFKRGDVWTLDNSINSSSWAVVSGTETNPKVVSCYGIGNLPTINGLHTQTSSWNLETISGVGDVWWTTPSISPTLTVAHVKIDGSHERACSSKETLITDPEGGKWFYDSVSDRVYVNFDPTGHVIEWNDITAVFTFQAGSSFVYFSYLKFEHIREVAIVCSDTDGFKIENCTSGGYSQYGFKVSGKNFTIANNTVISHEKAYKPLASKYTTYLSGSYEGIRTYPKDRDGKNEIYCNTVDGFKHGAIMVNGANGTDPIPSNCNVFKNLLSLDDNVLDYGSRIGVQSMIENVDVHDNFLMYTGTTQNSGANVKYRDNIFYKIQNSKAGTKPYNTGIPFYFNVDDAGLVVDNVVFDSNISFMCDGEGFRVDGNNYAQIKNVSVTNNILFNNASERIVYDYKTIQNGTQLYVKTGYAYDPQDTLVASNILFNDNTDTSGSPDKVIAYGIESDLDLASSFYTVDEAEASTFAEGTVFEKNVQINPSVFVE